MSGGHFNSHGYIYYRVREFADELENDIENNDKEDECGYSPGFSEETLAILRENVQLLRAAAERMRHIDYLYSGDHGEDSFKEHMNELVSRGDS